MPVLFFCVRQIGNFLQSLVFFVQRGFKKILNRKIIHTTITLLDSVGNLDSLVVSSTCRLFRHVEKVRLLIKELLLHNAKSCLKQIARVFYVLLFSVFKIDYFKTLFN